LLVAELAGTKSDVIAFPDSIPRERSKRRRGLRANIRGLATIEYALLLVLNLAGSVALWKHVGESVRCRLQAASTSLAALDPTASKQAAHQYGVRAARRPSILRADELTSIARPCDPPLA
jgi:hypothetical protein